MPHIFSAEQEQIAAETRRYLQENFPAEKLRALIGQAGAWDQDFWRAAGEMGWTGISAGEADGGLGLGIVEACIVAQECGRVVAGAPFLNAAFVLTEALRHWGDAGASALIGAIARGEIRAAFVLSAPSQLTLSDGTVNGAVSALVGGAAATHVLTRVAQSGATHLAVVALDGADRTPIESLDNLRCPADLALDKAPALILKASDANAAAHALQCYAAILLAWEQIGGAEAVMLRARDYALERQAFGQPIGRFQAIKHRIAEMYVAIELARGNALRAALAFDVASAELTRNAAAARLSAIAAFEFSAREAIQVHGAIAVTWEHDLHLYYRRSRALASELGSALEWEDLLVDKLTGAAA